MSFYVKRVSTSTARIGWIGPIRSRAQAQRECDAWNDATSSDGSGWISTIHESSSEIRAEVRAWDKAKVYA